MHVRHFASRVLTRIAQATLTVALTAGITQSASATKLVGTDVNSGKLLYIVTPKTVITIANTGANPAGVVIGPNQEIIYALSGAGEIHSFNPYTYKDTTLAKGFTTPTNIFIEPGCASILITDTGVNKIFRLTLSNSAVTTFYNGPDQMTGIVYDTMGDIFANDAALKAIVQLNASGAIVNQTPGAMPLTTLNGLTYDAHTSLLFATSSTGQVIYSTPINLTTVNTISFTTVPVLESIVSDGAGNLYIVGGNGTTNTLFKYTILTAKQTQFNTIPGLDNVALIPFGPCLKTRGTDQSCEETSDEGTLAGVVTK